MGAVPGGGWAVAVGAGAPAGGEAFRVLQVLDEDRQSGERAHLLATDDALFECGGLGDGPFGVEGDYGVDLGVGGLDPVEGVAHEFGR